MRGASGKRGLGRAPRVGVVLVFCSFFFFFSKKLYWENYKTFTVQSLQSHTICSELTPEKYITTQVDLSFSYIQNILLLK